MKFENYCLDELKNWTLSEYNEGTEDQLDYYINENACKEGDKAYLYSHTDDTWQEMTIIRLIIRSDDMEYYDNLDEDILLSGEEEYKADTSAEFITDNNCYLVWFTYAKTPAAIQTNTSIPNRNIASEIVELFEDLLDAREIDIPCEDEEEEKIRIEESNARLYGMEYWHLIEAVESLLNGLPCRIETTMGGADATLRYEEGQLIAESKLLDEYLETYSME